MSSILNARSEVFEGINLRISSRKSRRFFAENKFQNFSGKVGINLISLAFVMGGILLTLGAVYLYQVNSLATKGFEMKEVENRINELNKKSQSLKIREVELKSMNNIEKDLENMDLVSSKEISYIEMAGPIAMK